MPSRKKAKSNDAGPSKPSGPSKHAAAEGENIPARRPRCRRGGLEDMPNLPLDVLLEIFEHLHPRDLLNLARTSLDFRTFLMSRDNSGLWKAARANVPGLPECPSFLSEPAYANVVFFHQCHLCSKTVPQIGRVFMKFGARYCKECEAKMLVDRHENEEVNEFLTSVEAYMNNNGKSGIEVPLPCLRTGSTKLYSRVQVMDFRDRWMAQRSKQARVKLLEEAEAHKKEVETWTPTFYGWVRSKSSARAKELRQLKEARIDGILTRLRQDGWDEEIALAGTNELKFSLSRQHFANKSVALTDAAWQRIQNEAKAWIGGIRDKRLHAILVKRLHPQFEVFRKYIEQWSDEHWPREDEEEKPMPPKQMMRLNDWLLVPEVRYLIEHRHDTEQLTDGHIIYTLKPQLVTLVHRWYCERQDELLVILGRELDTTPGEGLLQLARHAFDCTVCDERFMPFPDVLLHRCSTRHKRVSLDYKDIASEYWYALPWDPKMVCVNPRVFPDKARDLILKMGHNPDSVTHEAMGKSKTRLTCADCKPRLDGSYEVFDWKRALYHLDSMEHFNSSQPCYWVVLPVEVAEAVWNFETKAQQAAAEVKGRCPYDRYAYAYMCVARQCGKKFWYYEEEKLYAHLHEVHNISEEDAVKGKDYAESVYSTPTKIMPHVYFSHLRSGGVSVVSK